MPPTRMAGGHLLPTAGSKRFIDAGNSPQRADRGAPGQGNRRPGNEGARFSRKPNENQSPGKTLTIGARVLRGPPGPLQGDGRKRRKQEQATPLRSQGTPVEDFRGIPYPGRVRVPGSEAHPKRAGHQTSVFYVSPLQHLPVEKGIDLKPPSNHVKEGGEPAAARRLRGVRRPTRCKADIGPATTGEAGRSLGGRATATKATKRRVARGSGTADFTARPGPGLVRGKEKSQQEVKRWRPRPDPPEA